MTATFETERTVVRPWREDVAPRLFDILRRDEITRWFGTPRSLERESEALEKIRGWREVTAGDPRFGTWAIAQRDGGAPAGSVLLKPVEGRPGETEVGWYLHPDATGRGLATEAARGAIAKAFADGAPDVWAFTHPPNVPSHRVALAAGMTDLGVVVDHGYPGETRLFRARRPLAHDDAGAGAAVVLIHGHPFDRTMWAPQLAALGAGFRVIAPDLRGYGESPAAPAVTMRELADDVEALLDGLGIEQAAVVGLSMGGLVAMELATANPARWRKLALVATTAEPIDDDERAARHAMADAIAAGGMDPQADAMGPRLFGPGAPDDLRARIDRMMRANNPVGAVAALRGRAARPDYRPGLAALEIPVFVCTGTEDTWSTAAVTQTILDRVPGATVLSLPGVGHLPNLEATAEFNAALAAFLRG
ncbi:MAG: GNAT family N-acetyltransferase [Solirubrobacteraceae bacterium]